MNDLYKLSPANLVDTAKELTIKAIENGLITQYSESNDTAQSVLDFYHTLIEHLND